MAVVVGIALVSILGMGCVTVTASARLTASASLSGSSERESRSLGEPILKSDSTLVFLPPSQCAQFGNTPVTATAELTVLQNDCGTMMSELEREAAVAGFRVVSWQAIRPPVTGTAYELARALKVDGVVEVDQLSLASLNSDSELKYTVELGDGTGREIQVPKIQEVANRCREKYPLDKGLDVTTSVTSASASVKLVSATDSAVKWLYHRTLPSSSDLLAGETHVFEASSSVGPLAWGFGVGVPLISVGLGLGAGSSFVGPGGAIYGGVALLGLGALVTSLIVIGVSRPEPSDILCYERHRVVAPTEERAQNVDGPGSRHTFRTAKAAGLNSGSLQRRALLRSIARDVVRDLRQAQKLAPPAGSTGPIDKRQE
jgi:hypothetical protein